MSNRSPGTQVLAALAIATLVAAAPPVYAQIVHADSMRAPGGAPVDTTLKAIPDGTAPAPRADALSQVVALEDRRRKAMVAADMNTLETIIAPDATYVHSTGIMQNRDELLRLLADKSIQYVSFDVENTAYRVYGATVVGTGVQKLKVMQGKKSLVIRSRYTVVYTERNGVEQLIAYQATPLPDMTNVSTPKK